MDVKYIINFVFIILLILLFWKICFYICRNFRFIETLRYILEKLFQKLFGKHK